MQKSNSKENATDTRFINSNECSVFTEDEENEEESEVEEHSNVDLNQGNKMVE